MIIALIILLVIFTFAYSISSYFLIREMDMEPILLLAYSFLTFFYLVGLKWIFSLINSINPL